MLFRNEGEAETGSAVTDDRATIDIERGSTDAAAIQLGSAHACTDPFDDQRPFQLCHRRDDDHDGATERAVRVDRFALRQELDAEVVQFVENLEEVLGTPGEAVARPNQDDIEAMAVGVSAAVCLAQDAGLWCRRSRGRCTHRRSQNRADERNHEAHSTESLGAGPAWTLGCRAQLVSCKYLLVGAKPCRIAATRRSQGALSQRVDGKEEISFADLAFAFERTLACDYVDFAELSER